MFHHRVKLFEITSYIFSALLYLNLIICHLYHTAMKVDDPMVL